jgi:hypothetical protein
LGEIPYSLEAAYEKTTKDITSQCSVNELVDIFCDCGKQLSMDYHSPIFVLLDAYDESLDMERMELLSYLKQFRDAGVRLYITTRGELLQDLQTKDALKGAIPLKIEANERDVNMYLTKRLNVEKTTKGLSIALKNKIKERILESHRRWYGLNLLFFSSWVVGFCWRSYNWNVYVKNPILMRSKKLLVHCQRSLRMHISMS